MSPIVLASLRDGLLSVLSLCMSALVVALGTYGLAWLKAHTTQTQYATAQVAIGQVVAAVEQEMGNSPGAAKKDAALSATSKLVPWLPSDVASTLIEAGVASLNGITAQAAPAFLPPPTAGETPAAPPVEAGG